MDTSVRYIYKLSLIYPVMKSKRGFEFTIGAMVVLILGVLVLAVLIYGFTYGWDVFFDKTVGFSGGKNNVQSVLDACEIACTANNQYDYCTLPRKVVEGKEELMKTCKELESGYELKCSSVRC
ncbi:MAG: hypothetical protein RL557_1007 [archaeon]